MKIALFDFDGTIYPYETFETLRLHMRNNKKYKKYYKHFVRRFAPAYFGHKLHLVPKLKFQYKALESYIHAFKGATKEEMDEFFQTIASAMRQELRIDVMDRIRKLNNQNYYTMLVSGAFAPLLKAIFPNEFCHIIGSEVSYNDKGKLSTSIPFERVFGTRKIELIQQHFSDKNVNWKESEAYSDSATDLSMLKMVGKPVAVQPDESLNVIANKHNWEIITFS